MKAWVSLVAMNVGGLLGCAPQEEESGMKDEPRHIEVSSDSAVAYLSCMADHPPLINPIVIQAMNVSEGEDYCFDESYGIRWYFNDALFLDNPLGSWFFSGSDGFLSAEPDDGRVRFASNLDEFRERKTEVEFCINERIPFETLRLTIAHWDWVSFEATYDGVLEDGDTVAGVLSGSWRDDIVDCD